MVQKQLIEITGAGVNRLRGKVMGSRTSQSYRRHPVNNPLTLRKRHWLLTPTSRPCIRDVPA